MKALLSFGSTWIIQNDPRKGFGKGQDVLGLELFEVQKKHLKALGKFGIMLTALIFSILEGILTFLSIEQIKTISNIPIYRSSLNRLAHF